MRNLSNLIRGVAFGESKPYNRGVAFGESNLIIFEGWPLVRVMPYNKRGGLW